mmetsp:Transcript_119713/g.298579  ORF Transcript_119713/g.298579 Transcript_119713/m.298579 type:complete len:289 (+) Transcript_119713:120-986(+)
MWWQGRNNTVFRASRHTTQSCCSSSLCSCILAVRLRCCDSDCSRAIAGTVISRRLSNSPEVASPNISGRVSSCHRAASVRSALASSALAAAAARSSAASAARRSRATSSCLRRSWKPNVCAQSAAMIPWWSCNCSLSTRLSPRNSSHSLRLASALASASSNAARSALLAARAWANSSFNLASSSFRSSVASSSSESSGSSIDTGSASQAPCPGEVGGCAACPGLSTPRGRPAAPIATAASPKASASTRVARGSGLPSLMSAKPKLWPLRVLPVCAARSSSRSQGRHAT